MTADLSRRQLMRGQAVVVLGFLITCATYYQPGAGLTALIGFSTSWHARELPIVRSLPHYDDPGPGYDGRFYAQLAVDPLVTNPAMGAALDTPALRARRILLSWTAWALGFGNPRAILQVYAVQNIAAWMALAWVLKRWIPVTSARNLALWIGCLTGYGVLVSVRFSLTDLPAALLLGYAVRQIERARPLSAGIAVGLASLARETALVGSAVIGRSWMNRLPRWTSAIVTLALVFGPLLLWHLYLAGHHSWRMVAGVGNIGLPFAGAAWKVGEIGGSLAGGGLTVPIVATIAGLAGFFVQGAVVVRALVRRETRTAWVVLAATTFVLVLCTQPAPWAETPGAYLRLSLPLALGANVALAADLRLSWPVVVLANLGTVPGVLLFVLRWI